MGTSVPSNVRRLVWTPPLSSHRHAGRSALLRRHRGGAFPGGARGVPVAPSPVARGRALRTSHWRVVTMPSRLVSPRAALRRLRRISPAGRPLSANGRCGCSRPSRRRFSDSNHRAAFPFALSVRTTRRLSDCAGPAPPGPGRPPGAHSRGGSSVDAEPRGFEFCRLTIHERAPEGGAREGWAARRRAYDLALWGSGRRRGR